MEKETKIKPKMKTKTEIIKHMELNPFMCNFYLNGLLYCLGRGDLGVPSYEVLNEKRFNKILEELKK